MSKLEDFKLFVRKNPRLINYVKNNEMTWQKFYEMYDLYGSDNEIWKEYFNDKIEEKKEESKSKFNFGNVEEIVNMVKNMDVNKVQEGITSLQKAVDLFSSLFIKNDTQSQTTSSYTPRPIYRSFED